MANEEQAGARLAGHDACFFRGRALGWLPCPGTSWLKTGRGVFPVMLMWMQLWLCVIAIRPVRLLICYWMTSRKI